jgi:arylsulfatase A-like enzyme
VLIVVLDTVRDDALDLSGPDSDTPACRSLAVEGTVFTHALTTGAWTVPAHASLFTGLWPHEHGARHGSFVLADSLTTLAEDLSRASYATGSFITNPWLHSESGQVQGFEHHREVYRIASKVPDKGSAAAVDSAVAWIDDRGDRPFFAFVNLIDAHLPYAPTDRMLDRIDATVPDEVRPFTHLEHGRHITGEDPLTEAELEAVRLLYAAGVSHVDAQLGRLLDHLRLRGILDHTVVVVTSDHGEHLGEHGLLGHQFSLYDDLLRVPFIVRYPPALPAGERCDSPVSVVDVAPTVAALAGTELSWRPSGRSLLLALHEKDAEARPVVAEYARPVELIQNAWAPAHPDVNLSRFDRALVALHLGGYKYIRSSRGREWLFEIRRDPEETTNLLDGSGPRVEALRDSMAASLERIRGS